jgi:hypothetical protein
VRWNSSSSFVQHHTRPSTSIAQPPWAPSAIRDSGGPERVHVVSNGIEPVSGRST